MTITLLAPDGVPVSAQQERQAKAALFGGGAGKPLGGRSGFRVDTPSSILTSTSTTWTLKPCSAMIDPGAATHQGMYGWATDADISGALTAADATYGRKDLVYIQINDSSSGDGSGALTAPVLYLPGTPLATPVAPALPPRSFEVGIITVPKVGGGSPTVMVNPARFVAAGGVLPVFSSVERDALSKYDGLAVRRMDVAGRPVETWDGAAWRSSNHAGTTYPFLDPQPNWAFSGKCVVTPLSNGEKRVDVDLSIVRDGGAAFGLTGASIPQSLGVILPAEARGTPNTKALGTYLNGGGIGVIPLQVNVVPSTGEIEVRSQGAQSWGLNAAATVNLTYYI